MGHMTKKHNRRVAVLEAELGKLEEITKPRLRIQHRIRRIKEVELPKARRHKEKS